jgi:hypothetical protein
MSIATDMLVRTIEELIEDFADGNKSIVFKIGVNGDRFLTIVTTPK